MTLKPCPNPWCLSEDVEVYSRDHRSGFNWWLQCYDCGVISPISRTPEEAKAAWNDRPGPKVKPLVWQEGIVHWAHPLPGVKYVLCVNYTDGTVDVWLEHSDFRVRCKSQDEAIAAAQADWEKRIISALEGW